MGGVLRIGVLRNVRERLIYWSMREQYFRFSRRQSKQTKSVERRRHIMGKQGSQVSRIRRETHVIRPMHTLTRHTSYFSRREITRIAPNQFGPLFNSGTGRNQMGSPYEGWPDVLFCPDMPSFWDTLKKKVSGRNFKIVRDFIKASYMFTLNLRCVPLGWSQTS